MNDQIELPIYTAEYLSERSVAELVNTLIEDEDRAPRNLIDECAKRGDAMTKHLGILHDEDFLWDTEASNGEWWLRFHAACIFGLIPSEEAGLKLVGIMYRLAQYDDDVQDWLSGYWPALFQNKPDSVMPAVIALCEDKEVCEFIRSNGVKVVCAAAARQGGEKLEQTLTWIASLVSDEEDNWDFRLSAADVLLHFPRDPYRPLLEDLAEEQGGYYLRYFLEADVQKAYAGNHGQPEWEQFTDPWDFYQPKSIAERQKRWEKDALNQARAKLERKKDSQNHRYEPSPVIETYIRPEPKIGRNDPCPCGSGKKYKKCCQANE